MSTAEFWNGILREHAQAHTIAERVTKAVTSKEYRGWSIDWGYGQYTATGPDYDASYEGPEDGWVDNGHRVSARTLPDLCAEVDAFLAERAAEGGVR
jgi:hypothetical protein